MSCWNQKEKEKFRTEHPVIMPRLQVNHRYPRGDVKTYFDLIFASDHPEYKGLVSIAGRKKTTGEMRLVGMIPAEQLGNWSSKMHVSRQYDYYYCKAQHSGNGTWGSEGVFAYNALYVDIDTHSGHARKAEQQIIPLIMEILPEEGYPTPNIVEYSGRGIHLVWLIEQVAATLHWMVREVSNALALSVKNIILNYGITGYTIDTSYSSNISGLTRIPGTYNTAAKGYAAYDICHTQRLDLPKIYDTVAPNSNLKKQLVTAMSDSQIIGQERADSLLKLHQIRPIEQGYRDLYLLHLFSAQQMAGMENTYALEQALKVNRTFDQPLSEHEVSRNLSTAMRKTYHFTNAKIISDLGITEDEQRAIGLTSTSQRRDSNRARKARTATKRRHRNHSIMRYYLLGMSISEIAKQVHHAYNTVKRVVAQHKDHVSTLFCRKELQHIMCQRVRALILALHKSKVRYNPPISRNFIYRSTKYYAYTPMRAAKEQPVVSSTVNHLGLGGRLPCSMVNGLHSRCVGSPAG